MSDYPQLSSLSIVSALDDIPEISYIYRDDGMLVAMNAICERLTGVPRAAALGAFNLFANEAVMGSVLMQGYRRAFRGETQILPPAEMRLEKQRLGEIEVRSLSTWVETLLIPLERRPDGTAPYVLGIQRDVSALIHTRDEIESAKQQIDFQRDTIASLEAARREIEAQKMTIDALSTPVIEVWDGIVTLPLLGHFDAERVSRMTSELLDAVVRTQARYVILDLTGIAVIDTATSDHLLRIVASVGLLGATGVLVGIRAEVAQTLVGLGVGLEHLRLYQNLRQALKACMREQGLPGTGPLRTA
ncbi:STAS domain-containing protein [Sorangium sp. So ce375]|uniref:STAS domain-containing protein n=1 Tax=Sorangium sp. So ce375 TaxID=3133306 RepID=UPI003F5C150E